MAGQADHPRDGASPGGSFVRPDRRRLDEHLGERRRVFRPDLADSQSTRKDRRAGGVACPPDGLRVGGVDGRLPLTSAPGHGAASAAIQPIVRLALNQWTIRGSRLGSSRCPETRLKVRPGSCGDATIASPPSSTTRTSKPAAAAACQRSHVEPVCRRLDRVEPPVQLGSAAAAGEQAGSRRPPHFALDEDPRVHPRVERVGQDGDATRPALGERVGDRVTRLVRLADLEDEPSPIAARVPTGSAAHSIPSVVRFSPAAPGSMGGRRPGPADRLEGEEGDRPVRPAVDGVVALGVALEPERTDPGPLDAQLRHATGRDADLETRPRPVTAWFRAPPPVGSHPEDAEARLRDRRVERGGDAQGEDPPRVERIDDAVVPQPGGREVGRCPRARRSRGSAPRTRRARRRRAKPPRTVDRTRAACWPPMTLIRLFGHDHRKRGP